MTPARSSFLAGVPVLYFGYWSLNMGFLFSMNAVMPSLLSESEKEL